MMLSNIILSKQLSGAILLCVDSVMKEGDEQKCLGFCTETCLFCQNLKRMAFGNECVCKCMHLFTSCAKRRRIISSMLGE